MKTPLPVNIPYGFCHCGCGKRTKICKYDVPQQGYVKGQPRKFCRNHRPRDGKIDLVCAHCGKPFQQYPSLLESKDKKDACCSHRCASLHKRGRPQPKRPDISTSQLVKEYEAGANCSELARKYHIFASTIIRRLRRAGVKIIFSSNWAKSHTCSDGHVADSKLEYLVDEWLTAHHIPHKIHPHLPWHRKRLADFVVKDTFIEVWGMERKPWYAPRTVKKLLDYKLHGAKLISLYPEQIERGDFSALLPLIGS